MLATVPVTTYSSLTIGYRQTFYNLYKEEKAVLPEEDLEALPTDIYIKPNYSFWDANLRYTADIHSSGQFYISLYGADDRFKYQVSQPGGYGINAKEKNRQYAGATSYKHYWNNGVSGTILFSFSSYDSEIDHISLLKDGMNDNMINTRTDNSIGEFTVKAETSFSPSQRHSVTAGGAFQHYTTALAEDKKRLSNPSLYVSDLIALGPLSVNAGLRVDIPEVKKLYLQPRLSLTYCLQEEWSFTTAWGLYRL